MLPWRLRLLLDNKVRSTGATIYGCPCSFTMQSTKYSFRKGFTIIELISVVVIIAILTAIAIPNYIALRNRAYEASVKSNMHSMQAAAEEFNVLTDGIYAGDIDTRVNQVNPAVVGAVGNMSMAAGVRVPPFPNTALLRPHPGFKNPFNRLDNVVGNLLVPRPIVPPGPPAAPRGCIYYSSFQADLITPSAHGQPASAFAITGFGATRPIPITIP